MGNGVPAQTTYCPPAPSYAITLFSRKIGASVPTHTSRVLNVPLGQRSKGLTLGQAGQWIQFYEG